MTRGGRAHHADEVDLDRADEGLDVAGGDGAAAGDAGVGDDGVDTAVGGDGTLDGGRETGLVGDVAGEPDRAGPAALSSVARAARRSGSRPARTTLAPRAAARRAVCSPIPRAAPVTNTT